MAQVHATPAPAIAPPDQQRRLARLRRLADLLDARFRIPGLGIRVGLDSIIGLVPGIGDLAPAAVSAWIIAEARKLGVSRTTQTRMIANVAADVLLGTIPLLGDLFDVAWKANLRNLRLIEADLQRRDA